MTDLKDGDVVIDLGAVFLRNALRDPDNVPALLLLQLQVGVEHAAVELLHERVHVQLHLVLEELVLQGFLARVVARPFEQTAVLSIELRDLLNVIRIVGPSQGRQTVGVESPALGVELGAVLLGEFCAEAVDCDHEGAPVCLERQDGAHDIGSGSPQGLAVAVERLQVRLIKRVPDDLDVEFIQVLLADTLPEELR